MPASTDFVILDRIDHAVQDHRPHPVREHVGVGLAEKRAVGEAAIGQLAIADQLAQIVEVADRIGGGDVGQQGAAQRLAPPRIVDGLGHVAS